MKSPLPAHRPLPRGYVLDVYKFEGVLGSPGAFGITYAATHVNEGTRVAIKELFPSDYVLRDASGEVIVQTLANRNLFIEAVKMFRREADVLTQVKHTNIVRVFDYLEANGTAYMVMEYEDGYDLREHLERQKPGRLNENELRKLLLPILDGLEAVHSVNYLHRDIKPANIYLTRQHKPLLLDFGAARLVVMNSTRAVDQILTPPYGPIEQYSAVSKQGPYTDLYALGVVAFKAMLSEDRFPAAPDRMVQDSFVPLVQRLHGLEYSTRFLEAIDWALKFEAKDRPQTIAAWRNALVNEPTHRNHLIEIPPVYIVPPPVHFTTVTPEGEEKAAYWKRLAIVLVILLSVLLLALLIGSILFFWR